MDIQQIIEKTEVFEYSEADFTWHTQSWEDKNPSEFNRFDKDLCRRWDSAMADDMFRYDVNHIVTRVLPGLKQYVCQLNTKRNDARRAPQAISSVTQPFNHKTFNFNKVNKNEILFHLRKISSTEETQPCARAHLHEHADRPNGSASLINDLEKKCCSSQTDKESQTTSHAMIINVSPMGYSHSVFAPYRTACLPQVLTQNTLTLAIETILLSKHRGFTIGFNSLCANASVNHLHFHCLHLEHELLASFCSVTPLKGQIFEVKSLAIPGFALQLHGSSVSTLARLSYNISNYLHHNQVAHNVIICRGVAFGEDRASSLTTVRLFIWPRQKYLFGSEDYVSFFVACFELAGYVTTFDETTYNNLNESEADGIIAAKKLQPSAYESIRNDVIKMGE